MADGLPVFGVVDSIYIVEARGQATAVRTHGNPRYRNRRDLHDEASVGEVLYPDAISGGESHPAPPGVEAKTLAKWVVLSQNHNLRARGDVPHRRLPEPGCEDESCVVAAEGNLRHRHPQVRLWKA